MSPTLKLLPFLFLAATACTNRDETTKNLRAEIELRHHQKTSLEAEIARKSSELGNKTEEFTREKAELEQALKDKIAELEEAERKLSEVENLQSDFDRKASALAQDINEKTRTLQGLLTKIEGLGPELAKAEGLQDELEKTRTELARLQTVVRSRDDELSRKLARLDAELDTRKTEVARLKEQVRQSRSDAQPELDKATTALSQLQLEKTRTEQDHALIQKTQETLLQPLAGMYYGEAQLSLADGKLCRPFLHVGTRGDMLQAVICEGGQVQWSKHKALAFAAPEAGDLVSRIGLEVKTERSASSCGARSTLLHSGNDFRFDSYMSAAMEGEARVEAEWNGEVLSLLSSGAKLLARDCESLTKFGANDSVLDPALLPLLKEVTLVCQLSSEPTPSPELETGCFTEAGDFAR